MATQDLAPGVLQGREDDLISSSMAGIITKPQDVDMVLFHGGCPDGFGAAYAAWLLLGDKAEYIGIGHGPDKKAPDVTGRHVAILDFSFDAAETANLITKASSLVILDHHASAKEVLAAVPDSNKVFEMRQSGATLSWDFFHAGKQCPLFFRYIEDKDIWRWALRGSKQFSAAFSLVPLPEAGQLKVPEDFSTWNALYQEEDAGISRIIAEGVVISKYQDTLCEQHNKRVSLRRLKQVPDKVVAVVNGTVLASEIGNYIANLRPDADYVMVYTYVSGKQVWNMSLRSLFPKHGADVSEIAKLFEGGGHRAAAGCVYAGANLDDLFLPE
eukprot:CAMPEP_0114555032 /NCGR_PEP_ID=MMETSP0114-20121206/8531_1 /TAXON_ID=31324 /ORGANISM="Goniomonas sp, Strain m" /LENGTH=327 /DNA_ID=CAMNT_0001740127 /DNA_START=12 /DNA_END=995 /DNA_ORIENTATION=+